MNDTELRDLRRAIERDFEHRRLPELPREAYRNFRAVRDERRLADLESSMRLQATRHGLRAR